MHVSYLFFHLLSRNDCCLQGIHMNKENGPYYQIIEVKIIFFIPNLHTMYVEIYNLNKNVKMEHERLRERKLEFHVLRHFGLRTQDKAL